MNSEAFPPPSALRARLIRFDAAGALCFEEDGLLIVQAGHVVAAGSYEALRREHSGPVEHLPGRILCAGFIDAHIHFPQHDVIASPAEDLLPWLERYTFPSEACYADAGFAARSADSFLAELLRHGVTTAAVYCSSHPQSVDAFMQAALDRKLRMIAGKCLMDRNCPEGVRDETEQSLRDTQMLIERWHEKARLGYAITPRFAASSSAAQLAGAGELAARFPSVWVQTHVNESLAEIAWLRELHPKQDYLQVYADAGLVRERSVFAHCIHQSAADFARLRQAGAAIAACPTSNQFLGSGNFDYAQCLERGVKLALASDVGGGMSFSPFTTMRAAYVAARSNARIGADSTTSLPLAKQGISLTAAQLWHMHSAGAAQSLGLGGVVGNLEAGAEADYLVLNPARIPLLERRLEQTQSVEEALFAIVMLGDERIIERVEIARAGKSSDFA